MTPTRSSSLQGVRSSVVSFRSGPPTAKFDQTVFGFGYRADARGLRPARWLLASALPFHLFDAFLQRRVLLAQLFDVRKAGANPFVRRRTCPARCGHWSSLWPWSADGVSRPSDCSISSSCRSRSVNSIARRRNWCATAERRCSSCARRSSRSMVFTISQSALPCTPLPRGCRRRVRGSSGSSLRWLFLVSLLKRWVPGAPGDRRPTAAEHVLEDLIRLSLWDCPAKAAAATVGAWYGEVSRTVRASLAGRGRKFHAPTGAHL